MTRQFMGRFEKQGGEYVLVLPGDIDQYSPFKRGDEVCMDLEDGRLIMRKARPGDQNTVKIR